MRRRAGSVVACPQCGREFDARERFCDACRLPLVHPQSAADGETTSERHARARKVKPQLAEGPLVKVAAAASQPEGELIQALLLDHGIPSLLRRSAGFDVPNFLAAGPRDVLVPQAAEALAREVLGA